MVLHLLLMVVRSLGEVGTVSLRGSLVLEGDEDEALRGACGDAARRMRRGGAGRVSCVLCTGSWLGSGPGGGRRAMRRKCSHVPHASPLVLALP